MWKKTFFYLGLLQIVITYGFMLLGANETLIVSLVSLHAVLTGILIMLNGFGMVRVIIDKAQGRG